MEFRRHKDVIATFNQKFIATNIFPREIGKKIVKASVIREDSDYEFDLYINLNDVKNQIETAETIYNLAINYIEEWFNSNNVSDNFKNRLNEIKNL